MTHFADRLQQQTLAKGAPVCVGLDPVYDRLPAALREDPSFNDAEDAEAVADAFFEFGSKVLRAVAPHVPAVKLQSACFERYLWDGVECYHNLVQEAHALGLIVIGDVKRGDIGPSAAHYAAGCLLDPPFVSQEGMSGPDAITVSGYFGDDGLQPFIDAARTSGKGLFALVRTSNPGGDALQSLALADGGTVADAMARMVARLGDGEGLIGESGESLLGAVVGATKPDDAARLRELMPRQVFLVPGFGAQGGSADDVRACFRDDGTGALITASRSITYAYEGTDTADWAGAVASAAADMKQQIAALRAG